MPLRPLVAASLVAAMGIGCGGGPPSPAGSVDPAAERLALAATTGAAPAPGQDDLARIYDREFARIQERASAIDSILHPLPLLRPAEESALRRFQNDQHLERARSLGIPPGTSSAELDRLIAEGRLVRLPDTTDHWVIRRLDYSTPVVTTDAAAMLRELARRFQDRLAQLGLPSYRIELTSLLRSADDQARLRAVNPNAAAGVSTHEFATTVDVAYNAFAPPQHPIIDVQAPEVPWLQPRLERLAAMSAELVAARRARELQTILGQVLIEMQDEGTVLVTYEQLQPVFHLTVARRL